MIWRPSFGGAAFVQNYSYDDASTKRVTRVAQNGPGISGELLLAHYG